MDTQVDPLVDLQVDPQVNPQADHTSGFSHLSDVHVDLSVVLRSGQIFSVDQTLDSLLDQNWVRRESRFQLVGDLGDQIQVRQFLSRLHYAHNCRFDLVFTGGRELGE